MELGRHGGVCGAPNAGGVAELISESDKTAKKALINKQTRDRENRRHESMHAAGEAPHTQRQRVLGIIGDAAASAMGGQYEDIGTVINARTPSRRIRSRLPGGQSSGTPRFLIAGEWRRRGRAPPLSAQGRKCRPIKWSHKQLAFY